MFVVVTEAVVGGPAGDMIKLVQSVYDQFSRLSLYGK